MLGVRLTTLLHKTLTVTETRSVDNETTLTGGVAAGAAMTLLGQSQPEAQRPIGPIVTPKPQTIISCWNVRTMAETTQAGQSAKVMKEYRIEVLEISEARWKGMGSVTLQSGEKVVYVGNDEVKQGGVAIIMSAGQREP